MHNSVSHYYRILACGVCLKIFASCTTEVPEPSYIKTNTTKANQNSGVIRENLPGVTITHTPYEDPGGPNGGTTPTHGGPGGWGDPHGGTNPNGTYSHSDPGSTSGGNTAPIHIDATALPDCAEKIANDIQSVANNPNNSGGPIIDLIQKIGASTSVKVKIVTGNIPDKNGDRVGARVEPYTPNTHQFTITINNATLHGDIHGRAATDLSLAKSIIHEYLHIYMHDWAERYTQLPPTTDLETIMQAWYDLNNIGANQQHATMGEFVSLMGKATMAYYNSTHSSIINQDTAEKLAWSGLSLSPAYLHKQANDPNYIKDAISINQAETYGKTGTVQTGLGSMTYPQAIGQVPCP